ncbi:MAG: hypothetical protein N5P05_001864 [Chroococcopsis gigantea SAG 12.99]|jgi:GT2 family glycosyltransferase|nr:glycosyltransferase family 2 protein [Chlorogloea purpurea SAG 13.99]MDV3000258.1 hypothetical protein [Chroococcopsis gigantea SAG 12.99]
MLESWQSQLMSKKQKLAVYQAHLLSVQTQLEGAILKIGKLTSLGREKSAGYEGIELIRESGLFDRDYYYNSYLKEEQSEVDPLWHYFDCGASLGYDPHPLFDTSFYVEQNQEIVNTGINPLVHYLTEGATKKRNPHPLFDVAYYLGQIKDGGEGSIEPLAHYLDGGALRGFNPHPLFDSSYYLQLYSRELEPSINPLVHYLTASVTQWPDTFPPLEFDEKIPRLHYTLPEFRRARKTQGSPKSDCPEYQQWLDKHYPAKSDLEKMKEDVARLPYQPLISVIMPVYNTPENFLRSAIESVLTQVYPHWELCIADDRSTRDHVSKIIAEYGVNNSRIKVVYRTENGHISAASNSALEIATGEFIALLDHDDLLAPHSLSEMVTLLNSHPEADMIYSDEDKMDENGNLTSPFFKPDWSPDLFLSVMYTCHLGIYRRSLIEEIGGFRQGYEGSQDYDLVLRLTEKTDKIFHIPNILYHWRMHPDSASANDKAKPYAYIAAKKSLTEAISRRKEGGVLTDTGQLGYYLTRYFIRSYDLVSIIIPTKNLGTLLDKCLSSIFSKTLYPNFEVILVDNGTSEEYSLDVIDKWRQREPVRLRYLLMDIPFNFSTLNNFAVTKAQGEYLLFLNNDTEIITPDWLDAMVEQAQRPSIGAVGALLLYEDNTIQHAGVIAGILGSAGHSHKNFPYGHPGYHNRLNVINNYSAVTGACLMCRRDVFSEVGGFEEKLGTSYNDVDLCFKMIEKGYYNVFLPHVTLYHYESKSRGYDVPCQNKRSRLMCEAKYIQKRWQTIVRYDPFYNRNLTLLKEDFSINSETISFQ